MRLAAPAILAVLICAAASAYGQAAIPIGAKRFDRAPAELGPKGEWVLYEKGAPRTEGTRRWLTQSVLVELQPGQAAAPLTGVPGIAKAQRRGKFAVVEFAGAPDAALIGADRLRKLPGVRAAEPMLARQLFAHSTPGALPFVPNDPLFIPDPAGPGYQWHLQNTGANGATAGIDVNVVPAWALYTGTGVRIAIVDDGLETTHPDLTTNVDTTIDRDFNDDDDDPSPGPEDFHGTACAGVAAARGGNGAGVTGVAPDATLVGLRLIAGPTTDLQEADAFAHAQDLIQVKSNSWGPFDNAYGQGGPGPLSLAAMQDAVKNGRGGKGTIFLWAAGNGNYSGDDSNYDGWANSPLAVAVSAINDKGRAAYYSEPGANILVCAPSSGGKQGVTTTDRTGASGYNQEGGTVEYPDFADTSYTNAFSGTSSATPAVAGVVALMLQANPNLTYRDVQEILVRSASQNDPYNGGWVTNGGGFHFHERYGAGLVNAGLATSMAVGWSKVDPLQTKTLSLTGLTQPIPDADNNGTALTFTVPLADNLRLEHVTVRVKATHPYNGQLEWRLTSPSGVNVRLARPRFSDTSTDLEWTFMATHFWGERSHGDWKLEVFDTTVDHAGFLEEAAITFHGTAVSPSLPLPAITSNWIVSGREGLALDYQITASNFPTHFDAGRYFYPGLPAGLTLDPDTGRITGTPTETGLFEAYIDATNTTGTGSIYCLFYILPATPSLSAAVEQPPSTKIIPFGYADPFTQTAVTHDGVDAIETAPVGDEDYSGIEFTINGPARLEFQWKVSSEKNYDYLVLAVDGYIRDYITGDQNWTLSSTDLGPGEHNVDIYYTKDEATAKGQDRGWIDQMVITPTTQAPAIATETIHAYQGVYFRHQLEADHAPSSYTAEGLPTGLTLHEPTGLIYGSVATLGSYPVTIHATNGLGVSTRVLNIEVSTVALGLAEAIDAPAQTIATSGDLSWNPQWLYASDGDDAARSGPIDHQQTSIMTTQVTGPCKVVFYWGVSSEKDYDYLRFHIDDVEQEAISGEVGWTRKSFFLPAGLHALKWTYTKDEFTASGLDSGLVDRFSIHHDADGDGIYSDIETWFGASDSSAASLPSLQLGRAASTTLTFPTVPGNDYLIQYSEDLVTWKSLIITATATNTTWTDLNAPNKSRRFYRVAIP